MRSFHLLCISILFSSCGDRAWNFVVGTYLIRLTPGSLQLAAIYGLLLTGSTILFSPMVGNWIDRNKRLKVVRLLLILQNTFFISSAVLILVCLHFVHAARSSSLMKTLQGLIVVLSAMSNLAGQGEKISVTKDWFVVVCHNNNDELAKANSLRRQMDLIVAVVAPFAVGALLDAIPDVSGIVFICLWNAVTKFIEYRILLHVYRKDADLRQKRGDDKATTLAAECINYATDDRNVVINQSTELADSKQSDLDVAEKVPNANTNTELTNVAEQNGADNTNNITNSKEGLDNTNAEEKTKDKQNRTGTQQQQEENIFERLKAVVYGWKIYYRQKVSLAGLALALLYSTVLDFNAITTAYAVSVGFNKMYISICFGMGSLCGVFGSFSFPFLRRFLGLPRTGIVGGFIQLSFLSLCVFSIWMPGSPSGFYHHGDLHHRNTTGGENSSNITDNIHPGGVYASNITSTTAGMHISTIITEILPTSSYITTGGTRKLNISTKKQPATKSGDANISIWFLFAGIILSRAGLWIADITVTQLQQEYVPAEERGVVGGVQNALNSSFDLIHYVVTVALPYPHEFWVLILISVSAVGCSFITYIVFNIVFHRMLMANSTKESNTKL